MKVRLAFTLDHQGMLPVTASQPGLPKVASSFLLCCTGGNDVLCAICVAQWEGADGLSPFGCDDLMDLLLACCIAAATG